MIEREKEREVNKSVHLSRVPTNNHRFYDKIILMPTFTTQLVANLAKYLGCRLEKFDDDPFQRKIKPYMY